MIDSQTSHIPGTAAERPALPGFRLHRFEVFNWGIFDGAVYTLEPRGQSTLLVGENGSGKSTLVDALLTLLVRPQTRNYNVAAGAMKNERDERTYIRGAYDRTIGDDGRPQVQYMRPGTAHYSALLAVFHNQATAEWISLCQVLYMNTDNSVEKIYATSNLERSIVRDLANLTSGSLLARQLRERGFETTASYNQYIHWLQRQTGLKSKAMDIFNQTVAVKDVQRLDLFIRQHMLEKQPWNERVAKLLTHFNELSEAHRMLVRLRQQSDLLIPIVQAGEQYRKRVEELELVKQRLEAVPIYFASELEQLLEPLCAKWNQQLQFHESEMERLNGVLVRLRQDIARLEIEIESAGGDRLRRLPGLIEAAQQLARAKQDAFNRYVGFLRHCGISTPVTSPEQFHRVRAELSTKRNSLVEERESLRKKSGDVQYEIGRMSRELQEHRAEAEALGKRKGNLPESLIAMRERMCKDLKLAVGDIPFAAELLEVRPEERRWEGSIENVLHGFARSLLVPNDYYSRVAGYVDSTRLQDDQGRGQRLVYLRVSKRSPADSKHARSATLYSKLKYREHPLTPWVKGEILERFDYQACETLDEFAACNGAAMTIHRHFKKGAVRHEKDDRNAPDDRRHFVLGWDNREKRSAILDAIRDMERDLDSLHQRGRSLEEKTDDATRMISQLDQAANYSDYDEIDAARHDFEVSQLRLEKERLEASNNVVRELKRKADALRGEEHGYQHDRDRHLESKTQLSTELRNGDRILNTARQRLEDCRRKGNWERARSHFESIEEQVRTPLTLENLGILPENVERDLRDRLEALAAKLEPLKKDVISAMAKYLRAFPEDNPDLDPEVASLDSFTALYERLSKDDLPRHEERFRNRLNEKVLHEVGLLNSSLENDRQEIRDKIEQLNGALRLLEWKAGTTMRLEATDIADREIHDFRRELASCLSGTLEGTPEANEATFVRIEKLVSKLRDPANERWRDKVVDVRNWFNFAAREIVTATGQSRSYYEGGTGQSGGEKGKLAFLVLVAAIAYQYDLDPDDENRNRFHFVMVDEMFSRSDDAHAEYALDLFQRFGLQLLIVAPLDAKARVTEPYVGTYVHVVKNKDTHRSALITITAEELQDAVAPG
ncbi:MAG: ATP-binding protein [Planctomycetota bacterium]|jgi:uncharacterized protein YPO0396